MEPKIASATTVPRPLGTEIVPLANIFSGNEFHAAWCVVHERHERSDDGKLSHICLDLSAQAPKGRFDHIVLQVLLRDPGKSLTTFSVFF